MFSVLVVLYMQVFTIPSGCDGASCDYMARWFRDGDSLLFELSTRTSGWVAIGISADSQMSGGAFDDVIACQAVVGGGAVNARDMNNPTGSRRNQADMVSREGRVLCDASFHCFCIMHCD